MQAGNRTVGGVATRIVSPRPLASGGIVADELPAFSQQPCVQAVSRPCLQSAEIDARGEQCLQGHGASIGLYCGSLPARTLPMKKTLVTAGMLAAALTLSVSAHSAEHKLTRLWESDAALKTPESVRFD